MLIGPFGQLEAEEKMRLGVEEYKQKLATELETVSRQLASERKKQQALEVYRDKVTLFGRLS